MRAAETGGLPLRYYGNETAEADEKRGVVEDTEGRVAAQDFSREESRGLSTDRAVCPICPHACALAEGQTGLCRARVAEGGQVMDANYGRITSLALDPIEKKPLARFRPGSKVLSVGSYGCNLRCPFCQNASIACAGERDVPWREIAPAELVESAASLVPEGNIGLAFTYNEPLVGLEFVRDTGRLAHERGLTNVLVSNGYVNDGPLHEVAPLIDAANIDLKGFTPELLRPCRRQLGHRKAHHRSAGRHTHLPPGSDDARHPRPERQRSGNRRGRPMARLPGSVDSLPPDPLLPLPPPDRPPRHPTRNRPSPSRHSEALPKVCLRRELLRETA